jgi:hypothetical protein
MMGDWQLILQEMVKKNEVTDFELVNYGREIADFKPRDDGRVNFVKPCTAFVYAANLPPGLHQILIYCPKTNRAFVKEIVVDLSYTDQFPEFP